MDVGRHLVSWVLVAVGRGMFTGMSVEQGDKGSGGKGDGVCRGALRMSGLA